MGRMDFHYSQRDQHRHVILFLQSSTPTEFPRSVQKTNSSAHRLSRGSLVRLRLGPLPNWPPMGRWSLVYIFLFHPDSSPWRSAHVIVTMVVGGVLLIMFILWETIAPYPLFPKILFANKV